MKSLAPHDRPREKLARLGSGVLGDNELLAVVLGHGFRRDSALEIANRVLGLSDGVQGLTRVTERQLHKVDGIGPAKAAQVLAAIELGRRRSMAPRPWYCFTTIRRVIRHPAATTSRGRSVSPRPGS